MSVDGASLTRGELRQQVERLAGQLRTIGVVADDTVALVLPNGPAAAMMFLAAAGCARAAPLNPRYREFEYAAAFESLQPRVLVTSPAGGASIQALGPAGRHLVLDGELGDLRLSESGGPVAASSPEFAGADSIALVLHTSGTTGRPKMVPLTQRKLVASAKNIAGWLGLTAEDKCLSVMPLFHIHGLVAGLLSSLSATAPVVCTPGFDVRRFYGWIRDLRPTWFTAVPTMYQLLLSRVDDHQEVLADSGLRFVRTSSAPMPPTVMAQVESTFGVPLIEAYGMTEATHQIASNPAAPGVRKPGSVGLASGTQVRILTSAGTPAAVGEAGEILIRGATVIEAYEGSRAAQSDSFFEGWLRTGDEGYIDADGYLFLTGRLKEMINRGGEKVVPREIDEVLLTHPAIAQAVAFGIHDPILGEEVAAAVVLRKGADVTEEELRSYLASYLARFKVPRSISFVAEIPKGSTGKLQRAGLAEQLGLVE